MKLRSIEALKLYLSRSGAIILVLSTDPWQRNPNRPADRHTYSTGLPCLELWATPRVQAWHPVVVPLNQITRPLPEGEHP